MKSNIGPLFSISQKLFLLIEIFELALIQKIIIC
jgi:hypothetical protein